ncbi:MAG TPA: hypothetical protein PLV65_07040, partial [Tenuifilaceae bacterium]|nr:hypothetical protein [Tenuifilaceae bacterium]
MKYIGINIGFIKVFRLYAKALIFIVLAFIIAGASNIAVSQQPTYSFNASVTADSILIGDQVDLSIWAQVPNNYSISFPVFVDTIVTGIEVLNNPRIDTTILDDQRVEYSFKVKITSFDEGFYRIPPFALPFSSGNAIDTARTSPIWFLVSSLPPDTTIADIYDIKLPYSEPYTFAELAPWIGGGLLLIGLVAFLFYYISRRKKNKPIFFPPKPAEPAHVVALRQLDKIREEKLWNTDNHKEYHTALTNIIRQYIEDRFAVYAMEQTTDEIVKSLRNENVIPKELLLQLSENLSLSDLVKFARYTPLVSENETGLQFGYKFVNQT